MIDLIIGFVIAGVLFVVEYFLCVKLKNPLWGGIIPMLILIGTIWIFASGKVPLTIRNVFPFVIANTIFFGDWGTGREKYKKLQQAEMDKMKARDINYIAHNKGRLRLGADAFPYFPVYNSPVCFA